MKIAPIPWYKKMLGIARPSIYSRGAGSADMRTNGELAFLEWLVSRESSRTAPFVCFDVGANVGHYSEAVLEACRTHSVSCELHAFEPVAKSFAALQKVQAPAPSRISANDIALSDAVGETAIHYDQAGSSLASLHKRDIGISFEGTERIRTSTGKAYIDERGMRRIDLLKIDVEGHELKALKGFGDLLVPSRIRAIQFEYGGSYRDSGTTLKEAYALLQGKGYVIGRLLKDRVELRGYAAAMEDYAYSNYVALDPALAKSDILATPK